MNLEEGLELRQKEILDLDAEIKKIAEDAEPLKDYVTKYNKLKEKESELKKLKRKKENDFKIVTSFFQNVGEHYLDNIYPMFKDNQDANKREVIDVDQALRTVNPPIGDGILRQAQDDIQAKDEVG